MHTYNPFQASSSIAENRLIFATPGPGEKPGVPRTLEAAVNSEEVRNLLDSPEVLFAASQLRRESAEEEGHSQVARLNSSSEVRITIESGDPVDTVLRRGRIDSNNTPQPDADTQRTPDSQRLIGEGLEVSPEEQRFLLRVETEYRNAFNRASRRPNFNLAEFKQGQIARLSSRVSNNTKFQLNPGIPGSFGLGLHTDNAPYQEPTPEQTRALRGIEQRYNSALRAALRSNGNQPLPPQQLIAFKERQIAQFNQELGQTDTPIRLHMGIPESYSFGVDWAGKDATVPPGELALIGNSEGPRGPGESAEVDPRVQEMAEQIMKIIEAILQAVLDFLEGRENSGESEEEDSDGDLQEEIDRELSEPGATREGLREETATALEGSRAEARDLRGNIETAEADLAGLETREGELQAAIDNPEEGADIEDLTRQLKEVQEQQAALEGQINDMKARLTDLEENIIPRLERKLRMLSDTPEDEGENGPQLSEEQRVQIDAMVQELLSQLDPSIRDVLGEFTFGLTPDGEPALFPTSDGALRELAGERGHITATDIADPGFMDRLLGVIEAALDDEGDGFIEEPIEEEPGPGFGPEGVPEGLQDIIDQTQDGLTDYLQRTEDFVRRRVAMFRAHVRGTQQEIDDANGLNVFDWDRQNTLKTTLQQEQQSLDQALDALSKIDSVRAQVGAKIEESNNSTLSGDERIQALRDGRQILEGLRGLMQDPNYAAINEELAAIDESLGTWETITSVADYMAFKPVDEIWDEDLGPAWDEYIAPHLSAGIDLNNTEIGRYLEEVVEGFRMLKDGEISVSDFGQGYKEQFASMYGGTMENIQEILVENGVEPSDIAAFTAMVENSFDAGVDIAQDIQDNGIGAVAQETWDGVSQEVATAWDENVQPHLDELGIGDRESILASLNQIKDGFAILSEGTASEFGEGYKEQFLAMYGEGMQQLEEILVENGVEPSDIAAFTTMVENSFDAGVDIAQDT